MGSAAALERVGAAGSGKLHLLFSLLSDLMGHAGAQGDQSEGEGSPAEDAERSRSVAGAEERGREWEGERIVLVSNFTSALDVIQVSGSGSRMDGRLAGWLLVTDGQSFEWTALKMEHAA